MQLTSDQMKQLHQAALGFSALLGAWATSLPTQEKELIVTAGADGARLAFEYTPQPAPGFRITLIATDDATRLVLAEVPLKISAQCLQ